MIRAYGMGEGIRQFETLFRTYGAEIILLKGLTPIPFKLVTIASGIAAFNFPLFMLCAAITRGVRFFLIAFLLNRYGAPMQEFIEKRMNLVGTLFLIALVAGFAVVAFL